MSVPFQPGSSPGRWASNHPQWFWGRAGPFLPQPDVGRPAPQHPPRASREADPVDPRAPHIFAPRPAKDVFLVSPRRTLVEEVFSTLPPSEQRVRALGGLIVPGPAARRPQPGGGRPGNPAPPRRPAIRPRPVPPTGLPDHGKSHTRSPPVLRDAAPYSHPSLARPRNKPAPHARYPRLPPPGPAPAACA